MLESKPYPVVYRGEAHRELFSDISKSLGLEAAKGLQVASEAASVPPFYISDIRPRIVGGQSRGLPCTVTALAEEIKKCVDSYGGFIPSDIWQSPPAPHLAPSEAANHEGFVKFRDDVWGRGAALRPDADMLKKTALGIDLHPNEQHYGEEMLICRCGEELEGNGDCPSCHNHTVPPPLPSQPGDWEEGEEDEEFAMAGWRCGNCGALCSGARCGQCVQQAVAAPEPEALDVPAAAAAGSPIRKSPRQSQQAAEDDPPAHEQTEEPELEREITLRKKRNTGVGIRWGDQMRIATVRRRSAGDRCGLRQLIGWRLRSVDGQAVNSPERVCCLSTPEL
jgi:hypothetical protein